VCGIALSRGGICRDDKQFLGPGKVRWCVSLPSDSRLQLTAGMAGGEQKRVCSLNGLSEVVYRL
jgi:hypothetical protein